LNVTLPAAATEDPLARVTAIRERQAESLCGLPMHWRSLSTPPRRKAVWTEDFATGRARVSRNARAVALLGERVRDRCCERATGGADAGAARAFDATSRALRVGAHVSHASAHHAVRHLRFAAPAAHLIAYIATPPSSAASIAQGAIAAAAHHKEFIILEFAEVLFAPVAFV
jgi:hypothetical protein